MSKEKKKRTKDVVATLLHNRPVSARKLVPCITIPLDEYEFLRDVVDAARSASNAYGSATSLRAQHIAHLHLEKLLEKSSVLTERGAEELTTNQLSELDVTNHSGITEKLCDRLEKSIGPALGKKGKKR